MDLLLDTHVFLWWDAGGKRLSGHVRAVITDPASRVFVSAASVWEIAIKRQTGKLGYAKSAAAAIQSSRFIALPIEAVDAERADGLQWSHRDRFDRMLVAQSLEKSLTLVTCDPAMQTFTGIAMLWAGLTAGWTTRSIGSSRCVLRDARFARSSG